jgi:hypothetical protein
MRHPLRSAQRSTQFSELAEQPGQWRKWRWPVKTMAMPCSSAAAITSSSRTEPPGWMTDVMPAAAAAGIAVVVQPGGSVRDDEVIAAADEHGIAMVFTGQRHFRH